MQNWCLTIPQLGVAATFCSPIATLKERIHYRTVAPPLVWWNFSAEVFAQRVNPCFYDCLLAAGARGGFCKCVSLPI